jgi:hypothetical protein
MQAILPLLDRLGDGATPPAIAGEILNFAKGARTAPAITRRGNRPYQGGQHGS